MGGERIQTTAEHRPVEPPFFTHQGWQKAGTLAIGQEVMRSDGQWRFAAAMAITQADHRTEFDQPQLVYNIEVAHAHTYFIGKWMWWVHNANVCVSKIVKEGAEKVAKEGVEAAKKLINGELLTGTYKNLKNAGRKGDNLTPHHIPSDAYMKRNGGGK